MKKILIIVFLFGLIAVSGCSKSDKSSQNIKKEITGQNTPSVELTAKGKEIFYKESDKTGLKCADCHSDGTNTSNSHTKYTADIFNANKRPSTYCGTFKGDDVSKNAGGAVLCWKSFFKMDTPLNEEQIKSLNAYFEFVGKDMEVKEFKFSTIALPKKDKAKLKEDQKKIASLKGDKIKGEKLFNETCKYCHGEKTNVKDVTSLSDDFDGDLNSIVFQIRIGSKHMPFYPYEIISDQDIADLSAFIIGKK